ncbi:MAG: 4Fe-4S binding protein [Candidatus Bathyarchaeota archaeon]|nr:MAG: 4Fe-4S binding protein [Candidatus Bathyarchaeota archaeon]
MMTGLIGALLLGTIVGGVIVAGVLAILIWIKDQTRRISYLRVFIQTAAVPVIFFGLIVGPFGLPQDPPVGNAPRDTLVGAEVFGEQFPDGLSVPILACYYPSGRTITCAIWQIQAYIFPFWNTGPGFGWGDFYTTSGLVRLSIVFGLVIVMSIVLGRFFCGWFCPFGLYMDLMIRIRKTFKKKYWKLSERMNDGLRQLRYIIIAVFLILSFFFGTEAIIGSQLIPGTERGGYVFSYFTAPFCQICPMRPLSVLIQSALGLMDFNFVISHNAGILSEVGYYVTSLNVVVLVLITIGALALRRFWCRICPLGGLISIFNRFPPFKRVSGIRLNKIEEKCTKCGICKRVCPPQVTEVYEEKGGDVTSPGCILCFRCVEMCPYEDCLEIRAVNKTLYKSRNWLKSLK